MSDFHLFISSTDTVDVRKNNDPSEFWIQFPKAYALEGNWEYVIKEISVTSDFKPRSKRLCGGILRQKLTTSHVKEY